MNRHANHKHSYAFPKAQQGIALLIAIVLLLLAGLMGILAMNVGIFEQRSSANDLRARIVNQAAEAGIAQGFEYLMRANFGMMNNVGLWERCDAGDTTFPCGAVPAARRGTMWRLKANQGGYSDTTADALPAAFQQFMLKLDQPLPTNAQGNLPVAYGAAPVLCRVPITDAGRRVTQINCSTSTDPADWDPARRVVTFVSIAQVRGDSGRTTLVQTVASSSVFAQAGSGPTVIASGSVTPNGGGDVVAMPDAGGPGLDISVWTRLNHSNGGAFGTCDRQTWLNSASLSLTDMRWRDNNAIPNSATCVTHGVEGWDVLDKDTDSGTNLDVRANEFPCDMFEFAFGVKTWQDTNSDGFCETRMPRINYTTPSGSVVQLYPDEAFLYQNAVQIIGGNAAYMRADQAATSVGASSRGIVWCLTDCLQGLNSNTQIGSAAAPVALVIDGSTTNHAQIFGLVFMRDPAATMDANTGGAAAFKFNAQSSVFGSVIIQGVVPTGSGGGLIYGDSDILKKLLDPGVQPPQFDTLGGGWSDRISY